MKIKRVFFLFMFLGLFLVGCQAEEPEATASLETTTVRSTLAEGRLEPRLSTNLAFSTAGRVAEVLVGEGDPVTAGQVLARLEILNLETRQAELARTGQELLAAQQALDALQNPQAAAQRLAQARFDLASLDQQIAALQEDLEAENSLSDPDELFAARLEAQIELLKAQTASIQAGLDEMGGSGISPDTLAAAETRLSAAQAAQVAAQAALQAVELTAPWDGTLAGLSLVVGQPVTAGQAVATLADFSEWVVRTDNLTEIEVVGLEPGQPVSLSLDALPEVELVGEIEAIRSLYEEKRGDITYTVTIVLEPTLDAQARWGMTAAVRLER